MLIAHLPAGYVLTSLVVKRPPGCPLTAALLAGSLAPDLDMLYFYLIDHQRHLHHTYWTHIPAFWIGLGVLGLGLAWLARREALAVVGVFFGNILLHLGLDTVTSTGILWLYPFSDQRFFWLHVPNRGGFWIANFCLHWTFLIEITVLGAAVVFFFHRRRLDRREAARALRGSFYANLL